MLAVFDHTVAMAPEALKNPEGGLVPPSTLKDGSLVKYFTSLNTNSVSVNLGSSGFVAYSAHKQNPLLPRLFSVVGDLFCVFQGHIENIPHLKQQYGLTKTASEVSIVIEAYRTLRDRGPYPPEQVVRDFKGKFAFVLYDSSAKSVFAAGDAEVSVPFFWGTDSENDIVFSDNEAVVKKACGKSFARFPKGCFFSSSGGLRSFEFANKELKPSPWIDSSGEVCGATFDIDEESRKSSKIPRIGSAEYLSSQYV